MSPPSIQERALIAWSDELLRPSPRPRVSPPLERALSLMIWLSLGLCVWALLSPRSVEELSHQLGAWVTLGLTFGLLWFSVTLSWVTRRAHAELGGDVHLATRGVYDQGYSARGLSAWLIAGVLTGLYVCLYRYPTLLSGWVQLINPLSLWLSDGVADHWFLYSALYSGAVLSYGVRVALKGRRSPYVLLRTASVCLAQLGLAFLLPYLFKSRGLPEFYPSYFWPLKPDYLLPFDYVIHPETGLASAQWGGLQVGRAMLLWGAVMSFIATPLLTYRFGKRWYCSWVCGCGALAETAGDPWRHLSPRGASARSWERWISGGVLALIIGLTILLWGNELSGRALLGADGSALFWDSYGLLVMMSFSGVIGVGLYPLLGSRSWCRFGCPQAAILGALQVLFKRFHIKTEPDACVSCGLYSHVCEMGIDVRSYAQTGEVVLRASCVGCGACEEVCPRGVIQLSSRP